MVILSIKTNFFSTLLCVLSLSLIHAQTSISPDSNNLLSNETTAINLQLAVSSRDYPATIGDNYRLSYRSSSGAIVTMDVQVENSGNVSLGIFGSVDAKGLTFVELKQKVEDLISKNYAHSLPELTIISLGAFRIGIQDVSSRLHYINAWGLTRLSEIVGTQDGKGVSRRNVELIARDGTKKRIDLQKSGNNVSLPSDPLVKPGDTVILHDPAVVVILEGEVRRPGAYELLGSEGLQTLIETFGGGFTSRADPERVRIQHSALVGNRIEYISLPAGYSSGPLLSDGDTVLVRAASEKLSLIWFEGSVIDSSTTSQDSGIAFGSNPLSSLSLAAAAAQSGSLKTSSTSEGSESRFSYQFREGQMLSDALQDVRSNFKASADLGFAVYYTVAATDSGKRVDIPALLSGSDMSTDVLLTPGSRIVIPAVSTKVMISGAVYMPGSVAYRPNSPAEYYMIQAGGVDPWRNSYGSYTVFDKFGKKRKASEPIQPGDQIHVKENSFFYQLERRVPVLASFLALTTSIVTLSLVYTQ